MFTKTKKSIAAAATAVVLTLGLGACGVDDADVVSKNLSKNADNFQINRQIVFYNGITNEYIAEVNGLCSVESDGGRLDVTCKVGEDQYIKNYLGLSDNVTWFALQTDPKSVSDARYEISFKPEAIIPDIEVR